LAAAGLQHLTGSRGAFTNQPAQQPAVKPKQAQPSLSTKHANAKARHIRKKQRRYERMKADWSAGQTARGSSRADVDQESEDEEEQAEKAQSRTARAEEHRKSKAEKRKLIKKKKKLEKRATAGDAQARSALDAILGAVPTAGGALSEGGTTRPRGSWTSDTEQQRRQQQGGGGASHDAKPKLLKLGVRVEELAPGNGPALQDRGRVKVAYVGRLGSAAGRVFDKAKSLSFRLGRGEVIKGWDIGLQGMRVGARRRLTVPPAAGYGAKGAGSDIPPHSTLVFDVTALG
jgi:FK506-binding nuclear protein